MKYNINDIKQGDIFFRVYKPIDFEKKELDTEFRKYEVSGVFNRSIELREITQSGRKKTSFRVFLKQGVFERFDGIYYHSSEIIEGVKEFLRIEVKPQHIDLMPTDEETSTIDYWMNNNRISITYWEGSAVFTINGYQLTGEYWDIFSLIKGIKKSKNFGINE